MTRAPTLIDKYEIIRRLGSGGMGTVYLGRDPGLGREVAIKVLRGPVFDTDDELLARFLQEARATAKLHHTNIVTVYEVGRHDHQPFIVMEFVPGDSLSRIIEERRPLPLATKLHYLEQLCAGLHFAHRAGVVHRDIKPANLMVDTEGMVRILDFGIAHLEDSRMTRDGDLIGTVNYMSPEQMLGRPVDHRSDIFAVGSVAYELLSYRQAFPGTMQDGLQQRLPYDPPAALSSLCSEIDSGLEALINLALEKAPENRQQDVAHVQAAISACRLRLLRQRGAAYEVIPAPPVEGFSATLHRQRPRTDAEEIRSDLLEAERRIQAGDAAGAVELAERLVRKAPSSVEAHALLVRAHAELLRDSSPPGRTGRFPRWGVAGAASAAALVGMLGLFNRQGPPRPSVTPVEASRPEPSAVPPSVSPDPPAPAVVPSWSSEPTRTPEPSTETRDTRPAEPETPVPGPASRSVPESDDRTAFDDRTRVPDNSTASSEIAPSSAVPVPPPIVPAPPPIVVASPPPVEAPPATPVETPAPAAPAISPLDRERPGVVAALEGYGNAYRNRSVEAMQDVFPSLPRERRQAYEKAFKDRRACPALDVRFGTPEIFLSGDDMASVTVLSTYTCKPSTAQSDPQESLTDVFRMQKAGGGWVITGMGAMK